MIGQSPVKTLSMFTNISAFWIFFRIISAQQVRSTSRKASYFRVFRVGSRISLSVLFGQIFVGNCMKMKKKKKIVAGKVMFLHLSVILVSYLADPPPGKADTPPPPPPQSCGYYRMQSVNGRYASYWNAYFFDVNPPLAYIETLITIFFRLGCVELKRDKRSFHWTYCRWQQSLLKSRKRDANIDAIGIKKLNIISTWLSVKMGFFRQMSYLRRKNLGKYSYQALKYWPLIPNLKG